VQRCTLSERSRKQPIPVSWAAPDELLALGGCYLRQPIQVLLFHRAVVPQAHRRLRVICQYECTPFTARQPRRLPS
jgi:hypothetical protein